MPDPRMVARRVTGRTLIHDQPCLLMGAEVSTLGASMTIYDTAKRIGVPASSRKAVLYATPVGSAEESDSLSLWTPLDMEQGLYVSLASTSSGTVYYQRAKKDTGVPSAVGDYMYTEDSLGFITFTDVEDREFLKERYIEYRDAGMLEGMVFWTDKDFGRTYTGGAQTGLISLYRDVAALNSAFESLYYFTAGPSPPEKRGVVLLNVTLATYGTVNADKLVADGYHVGFLSDSSDAALAYAIPNAALRAKFVAAGLDTVQKLIDRTTTVDFRTSSLTGTIEGLHWLVGLTGTGYLYLYVNQLSGTIPPELGNLSTLTRLRLNDNQLTGTVPPELGKLGNLNWLYLNSNQLTGTIPPELGNLSKLEVLTLSNNQLSGAVPAALGNLSKLGYLWLYTNQLTSWPEMTIPTSVANSWISIRVHNNLMATAATGVDRLITQVGISQQANPHTVASNLYVSGAGMAGPTWGTAAAPSDVAYSQRVLTYPGRNWTVTVQGSVDALVADLLPDLSYKYPLTASLTVAGTDFALGDVRLATLDGEAMFWIDGVDMSAYAVGAAEYVIALYDNSGRATFAFAGAVGAGEAQGAEINSGTLTARRLYVITATEVDHFGAGLEVADYFTSVGTETCNADNKVKAITDVPATGLRLVSASAGATRNVTHIHSAFAPNDVRKVNSHEVV